MLRSVDGGRVWEAHDAGLTAGGQDAFAPETILRGAGSLWTWYGKTVYRSRDGGVNWAAAVSGLPDRYIVRLFDLGNEVKALYNSSESIQDRIYGFSNATQRWGLDTAFPDYAYRFLSARGDTAFIMDRDGALKRKAGPGNSWENLTLPWSDSSGGKLSTAITAVLGDGDFMAEAAQNLDFRASGDRGRDWRGNGKVTCHRR